jgi:hypothetical protein
VRGRDGVERWQGLIRYRLDADAAIGKRATEPIPRASLPGSSLCISVTIASLVMIRIR